MRCCPRSLSFSARALAAAAVALVTLASPAAADPAGPSDFRAEVTEIAPSVDGVRAEIRGGDAFLEVSVDEGVEVVVEGYSSEPYLRFLADGTVERNAASPATYLNEDRKGAAEVPAGASADAEPDWEQVATGGTYAWHDHRVHWMGDASPSVDRGERVPGAYDPWRVPVSVDGVAVEVRGTLTYEEATSPLPWVALGLVVGAALALAGRQQPVRAGAAALVVASILAVVVGRADFAATPDGSGNVLLWVLPVVALVVAAVALALAARSAGVIACLAAVATISGWALLRLEVWMTPVLPTDLPYVLDRATVAVALGVAVGAGYLAVTSGLLALPDLADDE